MKRSRCVRFISFAAAVIMIIGMLPAAGVYAGKKTVVNCINVVGVTEPIPGEHPAFYAATDSDACFVDVNADSERFTNGVYWVENTKEGEYVRAMTESDTFREGYDYLIGICIVTASFAEFPNYYTGLLDAVVNGAKGVVWPGEDFVIVTCTFDCGPVIGSLALTVGGPKVGRSPVFDKIDTVRFESRNDDPAPQGQSNGVIWTENGTGKNLGSGDTFKEDTGYFFKASLYPKDGYSFSPSLKAYVNGGIATVTAAADHATVIIRMESDYDNPFKDVPGGSWYTKAALYCNYMGYMTGTSNTAFSPSAPFTRAMFVTVLAKVDMTDTSSYTGSSFTDVPEGKWYSKPIEWAAQNGYASGIGGGKFGPSKPVTREQLAVFLYNYTVKKGVTISGSADVGGYPDADSISGYAKDAIAWAVGNGLISGVKQGELVYLNPKGGASRAQVALIISNYVNLKTK